MTVVVVGAGGWLGSAICRELPEALPVRAAGDLDDILAAAGPRPVIVNAAGAKGGTPQELRRSNVELVTRLLDAAGWLVHLGSAAEYGLGAAIPVTESTPCAPTTDYGRTKLEGTGAALTGGRATVLRLFNVVDRPPQPGSPLADIRTRVLTAVRRGVEVEVLSGGTVRDYVSRDFVARSVAWAVTGRPEGLFNLGSGRPVSVGDIAAAAVAALGSAVGVTDLGQFPATALWCRPDAWEAVSGMREHLDGTAVAQLLVGDPEDALLTAPPRQGP